MYADVGAGITAAVESITEGLKPEKLDHEIQLVQRNIDFSGLNEEAKAALLRYLDPMEEAYNERKDVVTCLIGFDFDAFAASTSESDAAEEQFRGLATGKLTALAPTVAKAFEDAGLDKQDVELFFFPLPKVQEFRDLFQAKIGWIP